MGVGGMGAYVGCWGSGGCLMWDWLVGGWVERREGKGKEMWNGKRTAASGISVSRVGLGGSIGSGWWSGMEWMLSIGGIGVDAPEASGGGLGLSSAIPSIVL